VCVLKLAAKSAELIPKLCISDRFLLYTEIQMFPA